MSEIPVGLCQCGCGQVTNISRYSWAPKGRVKGQPGRFIKGHHNRPRPNWIVEDRGYETPCWVWQGALFRGYGHTNYEGKRRPAHRVVYIQSRGPVPEGLQLDHLCRVRCCVNPDHLEPVTQQENLRRGIGTKLTPERVCELRVLATNASPKELAEKFGLNEGTVRSAIFGLTWADLDVPPVPHKKRVRLGPGELIICKDCDRRQPHRSHGLCASCSSARYRRAQKKAAA